MVTRIVFVVNVDWFFVSHRLPLALEAIKRGWEVFLVTKDTGRFVELTTLGIKCVPVDFERSGRNPVSDLLIILRLQRIYRSLKPAIIHHVTLKPSIYGTIAATFSKKSRVVNAVSGLGYSFNSGRYSITTTIILGLMKWAFANKKSNFIFQNPDDQGFYNRLGFLTPINNIIIKGSGVDLDKFEYSAAIPKPKLIVTLLARMLKDKGVFEYIAAAEILRGELAESVEFHLVGGIDPENPAYITRETLANVCDGNYLIWYDFAEDVRAIYIQSDIVCLPSYREGLPKSLVEAMAVGRPIVTTDAIGCRECVEDSINGFLVPIRDSQQLARKIRCLVLDAKLRTEMGLASRTKMVAEMSLTHVVNQTFNFYMQLLCSR